MAFVTPSDGLLQSVVWFSVAALAVMLLLLFNIVRLRISLIARKKHEQRFIATWQPLLASSIAGEQAALPPLRRSDLVLFLKLWNHLHESLRGEARNQLNDVAERLGMPQLASPLLRDRNRGLQLIALTTLGNLQSRADWQAILDVARRPDPLLSLTAAHALFQIDPDAAFDDLKQDLIERRDWPESHLIVLLKESRSDRVYVALSEDAPRLAASADPADMHRLNRLLHLLQSAPYHLAIPAIRAILQQTQQDETIAQCLKFLREPGDLPLVRSHAAHPNWIVRLQATQALGRCGAADDLSLLAALLRDPVWWVRYRAAQAVMTLTRGDTQALQALRNRLDDRFALDMLDMVAAEGEQK